MLNIGVRKAINLETRTEESLELAGEDGTTFFAVGKCKDHDKFGCASSFKDRSGQSRKLYLLLHSIFTK